MSHHQDCGQSRSSWTSTSLQSSTRLLIWLQQMPPYSGNRSRLFTACCLLLHKMFVCVPASQVSLERIFLCAAFCLVADAVACSSPLKCAPDWIRKWRILVLWAVCLCLTAAFKQSAVCCFSKQRFILSLILVRLMWQYDATGKKSLCSWTNNTCSNTKIQHNQKTI